MLFATSCENDADVAPNAGEAAVVTFSVGTPEIVSRAYSDGLTATKLQYAVYNADGEILNDLTKTDEEIHGSTNVKLQLTTGNTYSVLFWAAAPEAPYDVNLATKTMTVNYENAACNDEKRDAFYKYHTFTVNGTQTETIELKRPFAQLNIGTSDYAASASADYTPTHSSVKVPVYTTLDLKTGDVYGQETQTFALAEIKKNEKFPVAGNEYIAMNYLLVSKDKELVDLEFVYTDGTNAKTRNVGSVPVQRNYRTNLYGKLLTSEVDINVEIESDFDGEFDNEGYFVVETNAAGNPTAVVVESAKGMATIANAIADGTIPSNAKIDLKGDIDLADLAEVMRSGAVASNWTPIGTSEKPFTGTFDGKGYTIKNLALVEAEAKEGKAYIGFFGYAKDATIKNVTFENVYINIPCLDIDHSQGHIGAVAGSLEGKSTIENVTVKGDIKVEATITANGASRVAVVAGGNSYGDVTMKNVHVIANEGSYLKANNNVGALAGQLQGKSVFENCSSNIDVTGTKFFAGGIIGLAAGDQLFTNCHTTGDVTITAGREGRANDHYRVGGIAGGWADGKTKVCTLTNCSYTGTISGTNSDGSVAEVLDYWGYVGRGYTLSNCAGSKVVIDGVSFVQKYDDVYGIYTVNGADYVSNGLYYAEDTKTYVVYNAEGLIALSETTIKGGETITLGADIDLKGKTFNGLNAFNSENNNTFDGKGYTVSNWTYTGKADDMGFIKNWVGTIKNLTVKNAVLRTGGRSAVIAAKPYGNIENCHVEDCNLQANYWACGLIAGMHNSGNMKNCTAKNSYIKSTGGTGAITGVLNETSGTRTYESCSATGCTIYNEGDDPYAGAAIIGLINIDNVTVKLANCTKSNNTYKGTAKDEFIGYNAGDNVTVTIE